MRNLAVTLAIGLTLAGCGAERSGRPAPAAPAGRSPVLSPVDRTIEAAATPFNLGNWYATGSAAAPARVSLEYVDLWAVAGMPEPHSTVKLHAIDCIVDESAHSLASRCGQRGTLGLADDRFRAVSLDRAHACFHVVEEPAPKEVVAWAEGGFAASAPKADSIVIVRTLTRTHVESLRLVGCEHRSSGCDPLPTYVPGKVTGEEPRTALVTPVSDAWRAARQAFQPGVPINVFWAQDTSMIFATEITRWIVPMTAPGPGPSVTDPRFRLAPMDGRDFEGYAREVRARLDAIDPRNESRDVRAALAVDLSVIALSLEDRAALGALQQRLDAVAAEFDHSSATRFGQAEVGAMKNVVSGVLAGAIETHDPCSVAPGGR